MLSVGSLFLALNMRFLGLHDNEPMLSAYCGNGSKINLIFVTPVSAHYSPNPQLSGTKNLNTHRSTALKANTREASAMPLGH